MRHSELKIDSHKLMFHPQRVAAWLEGDDIAPIYMEVSPSGACNHRCKFCGTDFMGYQKRFLPVELWRERVKEMGEMGIKAIMFAGEGEPFLHKDMEEIARLTKAVGIDVAFTSNGVLLEPERSERVLPFTSWIKISFNAGQPDTYSKIHRAKKDDYHAVMANMEHAARSRLENKSSCALGFQMLLLPDNIDEAVTLACNVRDAGCDYLVIKPYSQHPLSKTKIYNDIHYDKLDELEARLAETHTASFKTILRKDTASRWNEKERDYAHCHALPFWSYIDAGGNVWGCSMFMNDERWKYGNLHEESFSQIWHGKKRADSLQWAKEHLDARQCRVNCRMDKINCYLDELIHRGSHVNFI